MNLNLTLTVTLTVTCELADNHNFCGPRKISVGLFHAADIVGSGHLSAVNICPQRILADFCLYWTQADFCLYW